MTMVHLCHLKVLKKNSELRQITLHILVVCKLSKATYVKTEITVEGKNSADLIKTLKTIYNQQKGSRFYYEVLTQNIIRTNCCDKWEAKLNKDINHLSVFYNKFKK